MERFFSIQSGIPDMTLLTGHGVIRQGNIVLLRLTATVIPISVTRTSQAGERSNTRSRTRQAGITTLSTHPPVPGNIHRSRSMRMMSPISVTPRDPRLKYASLNGTTWYTQVVDNTPTMWTSIDVDSNNKPHIAYYDSRKLDLRFAWWEPYIRAHPFPR